MPLSFPDLGFSKLDITLLWLCPTFSVVGAIVNILVSDMDLTRPYKSGKKLDRSKYLMYFEWVIRRILLGVATGIIVSLYFVDALKESSTTVARILALSILFGYISPKFWFTLDKVVSMKVDSKLSEIIGASEKKADAN